MQVVNNILWAIVAIPLCIVAIVIVGFFWMIVIAVVRCIWGSIFGKFNY